MKEIGYYTASEYVARRAGCLHSSYRTTDGRYIVSDNDLRNALPLMTPEEYVSGFDLIPVTAEEAKVLVRNGGYQIGPPHSEEQEPAGTQEAAGDSTGGSPGEPAGEQPGEAEPEDETPNEGEEEE